MRALWIAELIGAGWIAAASAQTMTFSVTRTPNPAPEKGYEELKISKAALAGHEVRVWAAQMLEPDCSAHGTMTAEILEPPKHGTARLSDEPFYSGFPPTNVRFVCNKTKDPGESLFYKPAGDFHGHDKLVMRNSTSEGRIRKITIDIDVP
jgi:hypothetical protein